MTKKNSKNKKHLDIYETLYPVKLVVANEYVTLEDLKKRFMYVDDAELDEEINGGFASTTRVYDKKTKKACVLIKCNDHEIITNKALLTRVISHEALHFVMDVWSYINENINTNDSNETMCYLIGWASENIYETWTKK